MADTGDQINQEELDSLLNQLGMSDKTPAKPQEDIDRLVEEEMLKMLEEESKAPPASRPGSAEKGGAPQAARLAPTPPDAEEVVHRAEFPDLQEKGEHVPQPGNIERLLDISLLVSAELGRKIMSIKDILDLGEGAIVTLDTLAGETINLLVNNKKFAKGEVVVVADNLGIRITELISPLERLKNL